MSFKSLLFSLQSVFGVRYRRFYVLAIDIATNFVYGHMYSTTQMYSMFIVKLLKVPQVSCAIKVLVDRSGIVFFDILYR